MFYMIEKLKMLGLTSYEAQAYLALVRLSDAEANDIAANAKIPMGRIYNVLSSLEEAHLIRTQDTRPKRYACVEPDVAMQSLWKNKQKELRQIASEIETLASDLTQEHSRARAKNPDRNFWTVAIGEESRTYIRESILGTQKELLFFMASQMTSERIKNELMKESFPEILNAIDETLKKGVKVKILLNKDVDFSLLEELPAIKKLFTQTGCEIRLAAIPVTPFDIIDRETVSLKMLNPLDPEELFAVINVRNRKLAEELRKKFFTIWEKSGSYAGK